VAQGDKRPGETGGLQGGWHGVGLVNSGIFGRFGSGSSTGTLMDVKGCGVKMKMR
jgi:hypothetical protein